MSSSASAAGIIVRGTAAILGVLLVLTSVAYASPAQATEGAPTIVSLTFDDANADQLAAVSAMNAAGLDGTFYTVSGYVGAPGYLSLANLTAMEAAGHEIGGHTVTHADLTTLNLTDAKRQICMDRATLTGWGFDVTSFAYPYAEVNDQAETAVAECGYNSGRGLGDIQSRFGCSGCDFAETTPPSDPYYTRAADQVDSTWTMDDLTTFVTNAETTGGWVQLTFHHVCDGCNSLAVSPSLFAQFTQWLAARSTTHNTVVKTVDQVIGGSVKPIVAPPMPPAPGPGVNGLTNPGLESSGGNGLPECWMAGGFGNNTPTFSPASPGRSGAVAQRLTMANFTDGDAKLLTTFDLGRCSSTVTAGHTYDLRAWYQSSAPTQFAVYLRNSIGAWSYWTSSPWFPASHLYREAAWQTPTIPSGSTGISFGLSLFQNGELLTDDYALYDTTGAPPRLLELTKAWPWLGGVEKVEGTLTAHYSASWGPGAVNVEHQWLRNGTPIAGATGTEYVLVGEDAGTLLSVRATGTRDGYNPESTTSATSGVIALGDLAAGTPTVSGLLKVGHTVTADPGDWGPAPVTLSYQWKRNGTGIAGATSAAYTLIGDDMAATISVDVTATKLGYNTHTVTATPAGLVAEGDLVTADPTITGTPKIGATLTADPGTWAPAGLNLTYQWTKGGAPIAGATDPTYALTVADRGATLAVQVTGSLHGYGTEMRSSLGTSPIADGDLTATVPTISGTAEVGNTLTAATGTWGPGTVTLSYQWLRDGSPIAGATGAEYVIGVLDNGAEITVSVTGTRFGYVTQTLTSVPTADVAPGDLASSTPLVTGTAVVGEQLVANLGSWGPGVVELSVRWLRSGTPIADARSTSYLLTAADVGATITVKVTGVKDGYTTTTSESLPTAAVVPGTITAGHPSVTGTTRVGETLRAHPGSWAPDGLSFSYQWEKDGVVITGATAYAYLLQPTDLGATMSVQVTATMPGYTPLMVSSPATTTVSAGLLQAVDPTISGTPEMGNTLSATAVWGPGSVPLSYQWLRNGATIDGATTAEYLVTVADVGSNLTVAVTGTKPGYETATRTSEPKTVVSIDGLVSAIPTISGPAEVGGVLVAHTGSWGPAPVTLTPQWLRNGHTIRGAAGLSYTIKPSDQGARISVQVTGSQPGYTPVTITSGRTANVAAGTLTSSIPVIAGTHEVGKKLTVSPGTWGPAPVHLSYQWLRDGSEISGATGASYTLTRADQGHDLYVVVTGTKRGYATVSASPVGGPVRVEPRDLITQAIDEIVDQVSTTPSEATDPSTPQGGTLGALLVLLAALLGSGWLVARRIRSRL